MKTNIAFIFPGQGSQSVGMGQELAKKHPIAQEAFTNADDILGYQLSSVAWEGPEEKLNDTEYTQPAIFVHSIAVLRTIQSSDFNISAKFVAGHSMGELSALVSSGAMTFEDGLKLVQKRGKLMKKAGQISPGSMAAVLGLDIPVLEMICKDASVNGEIVQVANDNCPGQVVISGATPAIERAMVHAKEQGAKRVIPLAVSIAAHSPLMESVQKEYNQAVQETPIDDATIPIIGNVNAAPMKSALEIQKDLQAQLTHRVRWTESITHILSMNVNSFIEIGNGTVLSGLVKRINRDTKTIPLGTPKDFDNLYNAIS